MLITQVTEGRIPFNIPSVSEECFTFYKVIGDLASTDKTPLICLHGGPGAGHEYLLCFGKLWSERKIPVIFYDQVGCASSTHLRNTKGNESLWQEGLFIDELWNVINFFKLERYYLLGHSWGGALAAALAGTRPCGLQGLVLCGALTDVELQNKVSHTLEDELPSNFRDVIVKHDENQEYDKEEYEAAVEYFMKKHAYRDEPYPGEDLGYAIANFAEDDTVTETM